MIKYIKNLFKKYKTMDNESNLRQLTQRNNAELKALRNKRTKVCTICNKVRTSNVFCIDGRYVAVCTNCKADNWFDYTC